jgi:hypothetical protein
MDSLRGRVGMRSYSACLAFVRGQRTSWLTSHSGPWRAQAQALARGGRHRVVCPHGSHQGATCRGTPAPQCQCHWHTRHQCKVSVEPEGVIC